MHGDFSRGHRPDAKRGERYTRGFAQQRRLLLDSDLNAMTDALHERLRALANHLGCSKGSPDLGFLVTPGRLLALFSEIDDVVTASNALTYNRDYLHKYLDRYPSLYLHANQGVLGAATIQLRAEAEGETVFWCRAENETEVTVSGVTLTVPAATELQPVTISLPATVELLIDLDAGEAIWIGLIESFQAATSAPLFDFAAGYYYLNGLPLLNPTDATWSTNLFSTAAPVLAAGEQLLVYLEGWERHVSFVEDPGILEQALGGDTDTTTRGQAVGQVKLALVPAGFALDAFDEALNNPVLANGTLVVTTPPAAPDPDPCALPVQGGYTGRDNRLYRIEVHRGGALGAAGFKWSRDNGTELFPVINGTDDELTFPANTLLQPGDLVEVLTADSIELGDAELALLSGLNSFTPAVRTVGRLVQLQAGTSTETGVTFTLLEPDGITAVTLSTDFVYPLKVRRWHGLIHTTAGDTIYPLENGIEVELDGSFTPGDYWQYEARAAGDNANGPFQPTPHGPERNFAPLALLQIPTDVDNEPLLLQRWLDDRFAPLCELTADDIAFDGAPIGSESDTVQEVIEELWTRVGGGCCEFTLQPLDSDATASINEILQATTGEVTICFEPGVYTFSSVLVIADRKVSLKGCPRAVLVAASGEVMIQVQGTGRLELADLVLYGQGAAGVRVLIALAGDTTSLAAQAVGFFVAPSPNALPTVAVRVGAYTPGAFVLADPTLPTVSLALVAPSIRLDQCIVAADWGIAAPALNGLDIDGAFFSCGIGCIEVSALADAAVCASDLVAGVDLSDLQSWTPAGLLANADTFTEELLDTSGNAPAAALSVGIRVGTLMRGAVSTCRVLAGFGVVVSQLIEGQFRGNFYTVHWTGLHIVGAERTLVAGEQIQVSEVGFAALSGTFGLQLLLTGGLSLTDCAITGFRVGIAIGAESAGANLRRFVDLQIQNNQIAQADIGILLGRASGFAFFAELRHLAITENNISAQAAGILINIRGLFLTNLINRPAPVRVADNLITARLGIGVSGRDIEIADNLLRLVTGVGTRFGIVADDTTSMVCESNQIKVSAAAGAADATFTIALTAATIQLVGLLGPYLSGAGGIASAAILVIEGSAARVAGNTVHATTGLTLAGLVAEEHNQLVVKANEFLSGRIACTNTDDLLLLDNSIVGNATITSSTAGMVCDNRVRNQTETDGDLTIALASGNWKVADNRVDGALYIYPALQQQSGTINLGWWVGRAATSRYSAAGALAAIGVLADNASFTELIYPPYVEEWNPPVVEAVLVTPSPTAGVATYALDNANWAIDFQDALVESTVGSVVTVISNMLDDINDFSVIVIGTGTEAVYQVMCTANWAATVNVGYTSTFIQPNPSSTVQVIANRAGQTLSVKLYRHLVVALNVADNYLQANVGTQQQILEPNVLI